MITESHFKSKDGARMHMERHEARHNAKAVIAIVHGLNEHSGRYHHVAESLTRDFTVYLYDQRGHGKSDGVRAYCENFLDFAEDVGAYLNVIRRENPHQKIFLVGHSMGGQIVLNYLARHPKAPLAGFITSSANIRIGWTVNPIKRALGMALAGYFPKLRLPREIDEKYVSRDEAVVKDYIEDPLVNHSITLKLAREILANQETIMELAPRIKLPALMMHAGADKISAREGTEEFFNRLGSTDKTLKIYEDFYHEIFNEIGKEEVFEDVRSWVLSRL